MIRRKPHSTPWCAFSGLLVPILIGMMPTLVAAQQLTCDPKLRATLGVPTAPSNAQVGRAVAIDGRFAVVGASQGAFVFERMAGVWTLTQELVPSAPAQAFGSGVAIDDGRILVGAKWSGTAFVFRFDGTSWIEEAQLFPQGGIAGDEFGYSVALRGSLAVVGAPEVSLWGNPGWTYVFRFDGVNWIQEQQLVPSDGENEDRFGNAVDVDEDVIVVGAYNEGHTGQSFPDGTGAAYVYRFDVGAQLWLEETRLVSADPVPGELDQFGFDISLSGQRLLVGTNPISFSVSPIGSAYLFQQDGAQWAFEAKLVSSDGEGADRFGSAVALDGELALIGAWGEWSTGNGCPFPQICHSGSAYVFARQNGAWQQEAQFTRPGIQNGDNFAWSVDLSRGAAVLGAWGVDTIAPSAGAAYVYDLRGCAPPSVELGK